MKIVKMHGLMLIGVVACLALVLAPVAAQAQVKPDGDVCCLGDTGPVVEVAGNGKGISSSGPFPNQAPPNDDCANAIGPLAVPSVTAGYTSGGTIDSEFPTCETGVTSPGVLYTVIGTGNTMTASLCGANNGSGDYDSKISIYCQGCTTPLCVTGNDDTCGVQSEVEWCSQAGAEYLILVHGFGGATGNFDVAVFDDGTACSGAVECQLPDPEGACCEAAGPCFIGTEAECTAISGTYLGDGTTCFATEGPYTSSPALAIPDNTPAGVTDTLTVPGSFTIADVNVELHITHTWVGDLIITVTHVGSGISQEIWTRQCGGTDNINATSDDEGTETSCAVIAVGPANIDPSVGGQGPLSVFDGIDANGTWQLSLSDNAVGDTGTLDSWGLIFQDQGQSACEPQQQPEPAVPTLHGAGLAVLALLLVGGAILVIRRRL